MRQLADIVDRRADVVFAITRDRSHFPLARSSTPKPRFSQPGTMTLAQSATAAPSTPVVAAICAAEILGLAGFSIVPALLPQFIESWSLTNTHAGWLAGRIEGRSLTDFRTTRYENHRPHPRGPRVRRTKIGPRWPHFPRSPRDRLARPRALGCRKCRPCSHKTPDAVRRRPGRPASSEAVRASSQASCGRVRRAGPRGRGPGRRGVRCVGIWRRRSSGHRPG